MDTKSLVDQFKIEGILLNIKPYGEGHINSTFFVVTSKKKYILQKINSDLFQNVDYLMRNIFEVTSYIKKNYPDEETLTLVLTKENQLYIKYDDNYFRMYEFIENTICLQIVKTPEEFYETARAFGRFTKLLSHFDASKLYEILKDFHNTANRYDLFLKALESNSSERKKETQAEIHFIQNRKEYCSTIVRLLENHTMPLRVTHNDTKLNNILLDEKTHIGRAVIDLDTIMPGSICYDFGDAIRFGCNSSYEDEPDLTKVYFKKDLFEIFVKGYLQELAKEITVIEKDYLVDGAILMTLESGIRFLTDYLNHDIYFKISREKQNLDRCRTQLKLVEEMEQQKESLQEIVDKYYFLALHQN